MTQPSDGPAPRVSVVVANWKGAEVLPHCLAALTAQTYQDFEVVVVDNASADGSADDLETRWPGTRVCRLERNLGFAAANNVGAKQARGQWLAFLNNDAFPEPEWLERLMEAAAGNPQFVFFASRLLQAGAPELLDGTGDVVHVSGLAWRRHHGRPAAGAATTAEEVFGPTGAAALVRRDVFLEAGGFDERFFCYLEDVDLSFRLRAAGQRCLYVPGAVVRHLGSASHGARSDFVLYHGQRNLVWVYFKNMPSPLLWWYLPAHVVLNLVSLIWFTARGQGRAIWRAKFDAARGLPETLRQRSLVQPRRRVPAGELLRHLRRGWLEPYLSERRFQ